VEILRNLTRRKLRNALTVGGIVIGILALVTMGAIAEKFDRLVADGERFVSDHVIVTDASGSFLFARSLLPTAKVQEIERVRGVAAAFPTVFLLAKQDQGASFGPADIVRAAPPGFFEYEQIKLRVARGRDLAPDARGDVVLGADIAAEFKVKVGDTVMLPVPPANPPPGLQSHPFRVVGILEKVLTTADNLARVSFADGQMLLDEALPPVVRAGVQPGQFTNFVEVFGARGANLDELARRISEEVPGVKAELPSELAQQFKSVSLVFTAITTGSALLALVVGGLSVINTMVMAVTERVREIGLKKAVGARTGHILKEYLLEAAVIGLLGGAVGLAVGWSLTVAINAATASANLSLFLVTPRLALLAFVFALGMGAAAGFLPALRAGRLDPVRALRVL